MINIIKSKSGKPVVSWQGRLMASRFDPVAEAHGWVERRRDFIKQVKTVFVLGLGSGYHIQELLKHTTARILVIEASPEVASAVAEIHSFPSSRVGIECVRNSRSLRACVSVKRAVASSFVVLQHAPSLALEPKIYTAIHEQLIGRDWGSLTWQWQLREGYSLEATPRVEGGKEPLTIYDLEQTELVQNSEERERLLIKALRELVK